MLFFFKQKTEYVMRISDWSSDVCYSDLVARAIADGAMAREGRIEIVPGSERELLGRLDAERIEVALTLIRPGAHRFPTQSIIEEGYGIAMAADHPLAGRAMVAAEELASETMIVRRHCEALRSEEHTSELQSLMRNSYAVFCLQKKKKTVL